MLGIILYLILLAALFIFTWAALGLIYADVKEEKDQNEKFRGRVSETLDALFTMQDILRKWMEETNVSQDKGVEVINDCLRNINERIDDIDIQLMKYYGEPCEADESIDIPEKPKKKRSRKKKTVENREDLESL